MAKLVFNQALVMDQINAGAVSGLEKAAHHVLTEATKTIPHETGDMSRDGDVSVDADSLRATVFYQGLSDAYVVRQHEELDFRHDEGRRAKWLELTAQEEAGTVHTIIAEEIRKAHR